MPSKIKAFFTHSDKKLADNRWIFASMLVGAIFSLVAAFVLSVDVVSLARDPHTTLSCSVNAVINCATVAKHPTNQLFGFPNSFIGLISEPVVITVAIAGLVGIKFPRRFMFTAQIFYTLGFMFAFYLFYVSMFIIQALCPWCLLVTLSTAFVFFSMTRYNIREGNLYLPRKVEAKMKKWIEKDYDKLILFMIIFISIAMIYLKYGKDLLG